MNNLGTATDFVPLTKKITIQDIDAKPGLK